ncbi:MAG: hypothetical protein A2Y15_03465 [Clostridiales bacterium GWF2_36_10]|nr:MAG: hypothetical protein A2Y15_03465 [Clostridiales bacterium GWF2_36_10]HAN20793.1 hypothetical protein [Clostridiales bacterium]
MKNNNKIKKAFDLYAQNEAVKIPSDDLKQEFSEGFNIIIEDIVHKKHNRLIFKYWIAAAACCFLLFCSLYILPKLFNPTISSESSSDTFTKKLTDYNNLSELLEYLSNNDTHLNTLGGSVSISSKTDKEKVEPKVAVTYGKYCYSIYSSPNSDVHSINISVLAKDKTELKNSLELSHKCTKLFIYNKKLCIIYNYKEIINNEASYFAGVYLYDLTNPENPELINTIEQSGNLSDFYMVSGKLYIYTSDGVCACGYSHFKEKSKYIPSFKSNEKNVGLPEENIFILGSPSMIKYMALSIINVETAELNTVKAFYGDINECFNGTDFIAFKTQYYKNSEYKTEWYDPEVLYIFSISNESIEFDGKVNLNSQLGYTERFFYKEDYSIQTPYSSISIKNVFLENGYYRIIGSYYIVKSDNIEDKERGYVVGLFDSNLNTKFLEAKEV